MPRPEDILKQYWGYDSFRPLQAEIIQSVLQQRNTIALLPTGGGKSLCYQVPALCLDGVTLVVTPLIALMQEQVERLKELGVPAAFISSTHRREEIIKILNNTVHGGYKLLYLSPERLQTNLFNEFLPAINVSLIAVDEAHCISQWGHDFRPDYLKIAELKQIFKKTPIIAVTASATQEVQADIAKQLGIRDSAVFAQSFERKNIYYDIHYSEQKNADVANIITAQQGSIIIYCRSRKLTEQLSQQLQSRGIAAIPYHAGMKSEAREQNQQAWTNNEVKIIVATTAFGMGIDKADVRCVIHYDAPEHIEAYYQESGRAGRDGNQALSILLYNQSDIKRLEESTETQFPPYDFIRKVYQSVAEYLQIAIGTEPYQYYDFELTDFCKKFKLPAPATARALKLLEQEGLWTLTEAVFSPTTLKVLADRNEIDGLSRTYPEIGVLLTTALRLYGTLYYQPTTINTKVIAKHLRVKLTVVEQLLQQLHKMEMVLYSQPKYGPQLFFHHYRVDNRQLIINTDRINALKAAHQKRTEAILKFMSTTSKCRTQYMLSYFGQEESKPCGHCDVCKRKNTTHHSEKTIEQKVLALGTIRVADLSKQVPDYSTDEIMNTVRRMIDDGVLIYDKVSATITQA